MERKLEMQVSLKFDENAGKLFLIMVTLRIYSLLLYFFE